MGLLDAIPGLAEHQITAPAVVAAPDFDIEQAGRLISDALSIVSSLYPAGCLEWLEQNRKDVTQGLSQTEIEVNAAALAGERLRLVRALEVWVAAHKKAFGIFEARPPIVERQEELFKGAA